MQDDADDTPTFKPANKGYQRSDLVTEFAGKPASIAGLKRHLDLTTNQFDDLVAAQIIPAGITLDGARFNYIRYLRALARGEVMDGSQTGVKHDAKNERSKLAAAQREKIELEMDQKRGALVSMMDVKRHLTTAFASARTRLLGFPAKVAQEVSVLSRAAQVEAVLKKGITEILDELVEAAMDEKGEGSGAGSGVDATPTARLNRARVGR